MTTTPPIDPPPFADDFIVGTKPISEYMFGTPEKWRKVCHLANTARMPFVKVGSQWGVLKSELDRYMGKK